MRRGIAAAALIVVVSACGSDDEGASSDTASTTTTVSPWRFADDEAGTLRANQPLTNPEQIADAIAERELEEWVATCTENVPKLAFIGNKQAKKIWNNARQNEEKLAANCLAIGRDEADTQSAIQKSIKNSRDRLRDVDLSTTTTSTIDPNKAYISIKCPPRETEAVGSFRAEFDVEQSSPTEVREWGVNYGDGGSYKAITQKSAEDELYWHYYYETGTFEVSVWFIDVEGERTEATCTVRWSN